MKTTQAAVTVFFQAAKMVSFRIPRPQTLLRCKDSSDLDAPMRIAAKSQIDDYRAQYANNRNISFLPAITHTSTRRRVYSPSGRPASREVFWDLTGHLSSPNPAFFHTVFSFVGFGHELFPTTCHVSRNSVSRRGFCS